MVTKRKPNVSQTLMKNWISAFFSAIEIHNKPRIDFRYPTVIVLLMNAWELSLKAYIYKYQKNNKIILHDKKTDRYPSLEKCINLVLNWDENLIYRESISNINKYRNIVVHSFSNELDEIIFSLIYQNVILYTRFLNDFLKEDITGYDENFVLLPIGFKKPFDPIEFLWWKKSSIPASKQVQDFLKWIITSTEELYEKWMDDTLFVNYNLELVWKNKFKNADILVGISNDSPHKINKKTQIKLSSDPWVQTVREMTDSEIREEFPILYKNIPSLCKDRYNNFKQVQPFYNYYNEVKAENNKWYIWNYDTENKKYRFNDKIFEIFDKYYTKD